MNKILLKTLFILLSFALAACTSKVEEEKVLLAQVGTDKIYLETFEEEFSFVRSRYGASYPIDKEAALKLKAAYLRQMIDEKVILLEGKRLGITVGAEEVDAAVSEIRKNYSDAKSFETMLTKEYINFDKWKDKIKKKLLIDKVIVRSISSKIDISPEEINAYYTSYQTDFHREEQVKARQILLRDETDAVKVRERIREGEDFATVAKEVSQSPDSQEGGDLGFFSRGIMPPEFDEVVFTIKVGMLSEVVESPYGYHIFLVEEKREALDLSVEDVHARIVEILKRLKTDELYMKWMEGIKKKTPVKINEDILKQSMGIK
ncbi:MAG: peptidylprolyl isomerase [Proteobacteria bacterium]|nr:peptidylprolyl isomerase [Pseudomonadota bacterium]